MSADLFASVLHLDRLAIHALRISDAYSLHRVVYSLFPDVRDENEKHASESSGIQFADLGGDALGRKVILLSNRAPAVQVDGMYGEVQSKTLPLAFLQHKRYCFKVVINPTRRDNASKKLLPVRGRESIAAWFHERTEMNWGFSIDPRQLQVDKVDVLRFADKAQRPVTLVQAHLQGSLHVTDTQRFQDSFAHGLGRGRAFGCGLLQLVPIIDRTNT